MTNIKVIVATFGLVDELQRDTLEARMVKQRLDDLAAEFNLNGVETSIKIFKKTPEWVSIKNE